MAEALFLTCVRIYARVELSRHQVDPDDSKDEIHEDTNDENVSQRRDGLEEGIDDNPHSGVPRNKAEGTQGAERTEDSEGPGFAFLSIVLSCFGQRFRIG